ncbi:hypothetical protein EGH21_21575 [Halomicroarcula sp. F13]|uniref:DUF624 domain-containing protein n=1 Tax=Haloarcula rubra TaxID=2487747 RepID=A0AAW4PZB3_9EURY|nr:hypothetical protein [Halomicroarcula rubra]MBX0325617.1 hypothetical protein [Halomicroarcula rubra]
MTSETDQTAFRHALAEVPGFIYHNGLRLALISLAWTLASLPLVTIGPVTLAAYVAIRDLRSDCNRIDWDNVWTVLRQNGVASALFSGIPVAFGAVAVTYGVTALRQGSLAGELVALMAAYVALYVALALIPTYVKLAHGTDPVAAFRYGVSWLAHHPTPALAMGLLTVVVLAVTAVLTIAFVLLFAGIAFSIQVAVVESVDERIGETTVTENSRRKPRASGRG